MNKFLNNSTGVPTFDIKATVIGANNVTKFCRLESLRIRLGESPNEATFFVPFGEGEETTNPLQFPYPFYDNDISNMVELRLEGPNDNDPVSHYLCVTSYGLSYRSGERGVTYRAVDYLRGCFLRTNPIFKRYNNINFEDCFLPSDEQTRDFGIYYTNDGGSLQFLPIREFVDGEQVTYSLMSAYYAIMDIFYTPIRTLGLSAANYPQLIFSNSDDLVDILKEFKLKQCSYMPSCQLNALKDILEQVGGRYDMYAWGESRSINQQYLLITRRGHGPEFSGYNTNQELPNPKSLPYEIRDHHLELAYRDDEEVLVLKDDSNVDYTNVCDSVVFIGAPRQYLVYNAPVIPAWDWWNDYNIIVRKLSNNQIISPKTDSGQANPDYPAWLSNFTAEMEDLARSMSQFDYTDEVSRLSVYEHISVLWGEVLSTMSQMFTNNDTKVDYIVNLAIFDALYVNPQDPVHKYRLKRYVAVRDVPGTLTSQMGWDDPSLGRYKNISNVLIDGKRNDINERYYSDILRKVDTYKLGIPPVVEGFRPDYYLTEKDKLSGATDFVLRWQYIDGVTVDNENGFFIISNPKEVGVYFDKSKIATYEDMSQPLNFMTYPTGWMGIGSAARGANDANRQPYYQTVYMIPNSNGVKGVNFVSEYIPFRTRMRATFYYTASERYAELENYDKMDYYYKNNPGYLCGIYPESNIDVNDRLGIVVDQNMVYQDYEQTFSASSKPSVSFLQSGALTNDKYQFGKIYILLEWSHRNDYLKLRRKAELYYNEHKTPDVTGNMILPELLRAGAAGYVKETIYRHGYGLGGIYHCGVYKPISDVSHSFPAIQATIGFDRRISTFKEPFDVRYIHKIRAFEYFDVITDQDKNKNAQNQPKEARVEPEQDQKDKNALHDRTTGQKINTQVMGSIADVVTELASTFAPSITTFVQSLIDVGAVHELGSQINGDRSKSNDPQ